MMWSIRYLKRMISRRLVRSLLSILLAALLFFAFGHLTALRNVYEELQQTVKVQAIFYGGLPYTKALKIADSGYVAEPYYEYVTKDCDAEFKAADIVFTNRLDDIDSSPIVWLEGWDENSAMTSSSKICIMTAKHAESLGLSLGDSIRVNEQGYLARLCDEMGLTEEGEEDKLIAARDQKRPKLQIVGLIESEIVEPILYVPASSWMSFTWLFGYLTLDRATYLLQDYYQADEFTDYINDVLSTVDNPVKMQLDTSEADRIYQICRLMDALYPLTIAAALLLGSILPGLTVLHDSRDISILRALGAKKFRVLIIYIFSQMFLALLGLVIGLCAILLTRDLQLETVLGYFVGYAIAHLAGCGLGSGIFAWLTERKNVLTLLQARE